MWWHRVQKKKRVQRRLRYENPTDDFYSFEMIARNESKFELSVATVQFDLRYTPSPVLKSCQFHPTNAVPKRRSAVG